MDGVSVLYVPLSLVFMNLSVHKRLSPTEYGDFPGRPGKFGKAQRGRRNFWILGDSIDSNIFVVNIVVQHITSSSRALRGMI